MNRHRLASALRKYFASCAGAENARAVEIVRKEVLSAIPQIGKWFFCEVDGQDYAVRVSQESRIEVMRNIFNRESHPQPSRHT